MSARRLIAILIPARCNLAVARVAGVVRVPAPLSLRAERHRLRGSLLSEWVDSAASYCIPSQPVVPCTTSHHMIASADTWCRSLVIHRASRMARMCPRSTWRRTCASPAALPLPSCRYPASELLLLFSCARRCVRASVWLRRTLSGSHGSCRYWPTRED